MASTLNPYLSFRDNAREAMEFYQAALGGDLESNTFGEYGDPDAPEAEPDHARAAQHPRRLHPDGRRHPARHGARPRQQHRGQPQRRRRAELRGYWEKLSDGATVTVPLEKQMWGDEFGMLVDRFGIGWMVNIAGSQA